MIKQTIVWTDYDGAQQSGDFFFHLSKAEIIEIELSHKEGLVAAIERIIKAEDGLAILNEFKRIVLKAYGEKGEDGRGFNKSPEISREFSQTEAFSELIVKLATEAEAAAAFINGVIPADLQSNIKTVAKRKPKPIDGAPKPPAK